MAKKKWGEIKIDLSNGEVYIDGERCSDEVVEDTLRNYYWEIIGVK